MSPSLNSKEKGSKSTTYKSTRGGEENVPFLDMLFRGVPHDGGLYVPETLPFFTLDKIEQVSLAKILDRFSLFIYSNHFLTFNSR